MFLYVMIFMMWHIVPSFLSIPRMVRLH